MAARTRAVFNAALVRERVPNIAAAARRVGLRPATISDLCTGKTPVGEAKVKTLKALADIVGCRVDDLIVPAPVTAESFADSIRRWNASGDGSYVVGGPRAEVPIPVERSAAALRRLTRTGGDRPVSPDRTSGYAI